MDYEAFIKKSTPGGEVFNMTSIAILSGLGYLFMGFGALIIMVGVFVTFVKGTIDNVPFIAGVTTFLFGAGFVLVSCGAAILWPA